MTSTSARAVAERHAIKSTHNELQKLETTVYRARNYDPATMLELSKSLLSCKVTASFQDLFPEKTIYISISSYRMHIRIVSLSLSFCKVYVL